MPQILEHDPDQIIITGDISTGRNLTYDLSWLSRAFEGRHVMFVLGNHDYHKIGIHAAHEGVRALVGVRNNLTWLTEAGVMTIAPRTAMIGHEGWYDASLGDPSLLKYSLDWLWIKELWALPTMDDRLNQFAAMALKSANVLAHRLYAAMRDHDTIYVATHFPPWPEATSSLGVRLERFWLPYNTNAILGRTIESVASVFPEKKIVVLSGHTHMPNVYQVTHNLECRVSPAIRWGGRLNKSSIIEL